MSAYRNLSIKLFSFLFTMTIFAVGSRVLIANPPQFTHTPVYLGLDVPDTCTLYAAYQEHFMCQLDGQYLSGINGIVERIHDPDPQLKYGDLVLQYGQPETVREYRDTITATWVIDNARIMASIPRNANAVEYPFEVLWLNYTGV